LNYKSKQVCVFVCEREREGERGLSFFFFEVGFASEALNKGL